MYALAILSPDGPDDAIAICDLRAEPTSFPSATIICSGPKIRQRCAVFWRREASLERLKGQQTVAHLCKEWGADLNLNPAHLFPPDFYFEAGNKGTLSFSAVDHSKFRLEKEDKIMPFFETINYWGIQRKRTKIKCTNCGRLVGHIYDDGPPMTDSPGQFHMGPSQVIPRAPRYRFKTKAILISSY
ncbi:hypothetical protein ACLOJK_027761 [Asimina triloba]